ncbi:Cna B-type protein [Terriglobus saanensis SP1PR4]|uniref:Cna B-type protein n=1 Tax=Terriglobus saanensis (strain ATCC BAA-1853 / DSM 23119 / SP1PR4) TaxID=401053 RepID=E8UX37_TERSS|nr:Cna B-type protein [Terriglobus saanensis SP1PR4]
MHFSLKIRDNRSSLKFAVFVLTLALITGSAWAQSTLTGLVSDPSGAAIAGAQIQARNLNTNINRTAVTNERGYYTISALTSGTYSVQVNASGFTELTRTGVAMGEDQDLRLDLAVALGTEKATVQVNTQAPALQQETTAVSSSLEQEPIQNLPLNGRNITGLVALSPAVRAIGAFGSYTQSANSDGRISMAGAPPSFNTFLVDGNANELPTGGGPMVPLSPDATQEIILVTHNASAEYGRSGGGVVNYISRSGTNQLHGSAWEFAENDAFDANDYFSKNAKKPIPPLQFNQYGAALGGPILPDKLFFFVNYEGSKQTIGSNAFYTVPTDLQREGDFSQTFNASGNLIPIYNPITGSAQAPRTQFQGNVIPKGLLNPIAFKILSYYPEPNATGNPFTGVNNYFASGVQTTTRNAFGIRLDDYLTPTQRLAGRYSWDKGTLISPLYFGGQSVADPGFGPTIYPRTSAALLYTNVITPTLLLEAHAGFNRFGLVRNPISLGFDPGTLGFPSSLAPQMQLLEFPLFAMSTTSSIGSNQSDPSTQENNAYTFGGDATWVKGTHTFKTGAEMRDYQWNSIQGTGVLQFNFDANFTKGPSPTAAATNGYDLASLLLGYPSAGTLTRHQNYAYSTYYWSLYAQDNWKLTRKLVIDYGLRYDHEAGTTDRHNGISNFNPGLIYSAGAQHLSGGLQFVGTDGIARGNRDATWDNFAPRIGIAYSLNPKTVFRSAFGLFFLPTTGGYVRLGSTGFTSVTSYVPSLDGNQPSGTLGNPFPQGIVPITGSSLGPLTGLGTAITANVRDLKTGSTQQWSANLQRQVGVWALELGYIGTHGLHLPADYAFHHLPQQDLTQGSALQQLVPNPFAGIITNGSLSAAQVQRGQLEMNYPQFTGVTSLTNWAGSNFHAGIFEVRRQFVNQFYLLASYTYSKLLDNNLGNGENIYADTGSNTVQNWDNLKAEKAVSTSNLPHHLVISGNYVLPFGKSGNRLYKKLAGGWQLNGILTAESGNVISVTANAPAYGGARPNMIGNPTLPHPTVTSWLNKAAFANIPAFTYGNAPRNLPATRTQAYVNLDASAGKDVVLHDEIALTLKVEAFNLFNSTTFGTPDSNINDTNFGQVTTLRTGTAPRVLQFGARLHF